MRDTQEGKCEGSKVCERGGKDALIKPMHVRVCGLCDEDRIMYNN